MEQRILLGHLDYRYLNGLGSSALAIIVSCYVSIVEYITFLPFSTPASITILFP